MIKYRLYDRWQLNFFDADIYAFKSDDESIKKRLAVLWAIQHGYHLRFIDLSDANLSGLVLSDVDFSFANLSNVNFSNSRFSGAIFRCANMTGANCKYANFNNATLYRANMTGANCKNANFIKAELIYTNMTGADMRGAILEGHDLNRPKFKGAIFSKG
jgi:uncharacterized protein YjbI with pentapeptide repeats